MAKTANQRGTPRDRGESWLYVLVFFLSAALLFQSELLISKYILPWFGGTPNVWSVSMLFFQVVLFAGYAYSHAVATNLSPRRQAWLHVALLGASLVALLAQALVWGRPLLAGVALQPSTGNLPGLRILGILAASVGLPFFLLSTTTSLLQVWFGRAFPGRSPYPLFAVSNAGSLLGLLSYPFLVEPSLGLRSQAVAWTVLYALFAVCCGVLARRSVPAAAGPAPAANDTPPAAVSPPPTGRTRALWLTLAATASVVLLATTNQLADDVPVVPFMWAIPLAIYLLTFILAFSHRLLYHRLLFVAAAVVLMWFVGQATCKPSIQGSEIIGRMAVYYLALFVACMLCHGELSRLRPAPARLTDYYLCIAGGGALGGLFVALLAPLVFAELWELYIGYFLCGAAVLAVAAGDARSLLHRGRLRWPLRLAAGAVVLALAIGPLLLLGERAPRWCQPVFQPLARKLGLELSDASARVVATRRNFYGVLRVKEIRAPVPMRRLVHGQTIHGLQFASNDESSREPTAFYSVSSGIGLAIVNHPAYGGGTNRPGMRVGVIGLGAGTLAAYGRRGDTYRFYEINPAVIELAASPEAYFTFVRDSRATVEVVSGDARISLAREPPQAFDLLAVDAFNGDNMPVHLLTQEALALYLRHVREDGILALHVSSRHFDLVPLAVKLADGLQLASCCIDHDANSAWLESSRWVLLFRNPALAGLPVFTRAAAARPGSAALARLRPWTDDFSNLYQVLRTATASDPFRRSGLAKVKARQYRAAVADFTCAMELSPDNSQIYLERGVAYGELGDNRRAIADLDAAARLSPCSINVYRHRAAAYLRMQDTSRALADLDRVIELDSRSKREYLTRGTLLCMSNQPDPAIRDFTRAIALDPASAQAYLKRGVVRAMQGRLDEAVLDLDRAVALDPENREGYWNRGIAYARADRHREAVADLNQVIRLNAGDGVAYATRALSLLQLGRIPEARNDVREARRLGAKVPADVLNKLDRATAPPSPPATAPAP